jgi:hypothetical protein
MRNSRLDDVAAPYERVHTCKLSLEMRAKVSGKDIVVDSILNSIRGASARRGRNGERIWEGRRVVCSVSTCPRMILG